MKYYKYSHCLIKQKDKILYFFSELKDLGTSVHKILENDMPENVVETDEIDGTKNKLPFQNFLEQIDNTGELLENAAVDHIKQHRCIRAEMVARSMDETHYIKFSKARRVSFANKHRHKFSDWICLDGNIFVNINTLLFYTIIYYNLFLVDVTISKQAYTILSYLAYETVAQIVDLAFLVRQDQNKIYGDAIDRQRLNYINPYTYKPYYHGKVCITIQSINQYNIMYFMFYIIFLERLDETVNSFRNN